MSQSPPFTLCFQRQRVWNGQPGGITGTILLAESHLAIHTWPERAGVTLDVYVCNFTADNTGKAEQLFEALEEQNATGSAGESDNSVLGALDSRLREFRSQLPDDSETARAIDRGARLEEISEAAQQEGLTSLAAMLMEAEQEQARG